MTSPAFPDGIKVRPVALPRHDGVVGASPYSVEVPQRYYDWTMLLAHFPAPTDSVRSWVPDVRLQPVEYVPGHAVITLAAFQYRHPATLAPYDEFAIAVPVRLVNHDDPAPAYLLQRTREETAFWVRYLPVTTDESRHAGTSVWGLPKMVSQIKFEDAGWARRATVVDHGKLLLTLQSITGQGHEMRQEFATYSHLNGELVRSRIEARGRFHAWDGAGQASFELGDHPIADELRRVKVRNFAVAGLSGNAIRGRLYAPEAVRPRESVGSVS